MLKIELVPTKRWRNSKEYYTYTTYVCEGVEGVTMQGCIDGLLESGHKEDTFVEVWRGDTLVFHAAPLKSWVKGLPTKGEQPEQLRRE